MNKLNSFFLFLGYASLADRGHLSPAEKPILWRPRGIWDFGFWIYPVKLLRTLWDLTGKRMRKMYICNDINEQKISLIEIL